MDNFTMSENSGSFGMQQRQDRFDAIGDLIVGPPGPPGPQGPPGADGTVSFDELTPAQKESLRGEGVPAGGTTGQVLAKSSNADYATRWIDAGGNASLTILSYGHSTWSDFIAAYNSRSIVYCRASSGSDPASGSQTRLAFMAYVNSAASPTSVEFQYYRSVSSHNDAQQGDQVFIYKLTSAGAWTVTVRDAFTKIVAGTNMTSSYANGTLTLNATGGGTADALPLAGGTMEGDIDMDGNAVTGLPTPTANSDAVPKSYADEKYTKPSGGIPQTDLESAVQTSLGKADSALQSVPSTYRTASAQDAIDAVQDAKIETIAGSLAMIESSPATTAHVVGEYIVYNGKLYKVTAAIAAGQTLTVGTNIAATDTATAIKNSIAVNNTQASFLLSSIDASSLRSGRTGNFLMVTGWLRPTSDIAANTEFLDVGFNPKNAIYYGILHTSPGNVYLVQLNGTRARVNATLAANSFYNFCIIAFV